MAATMQTKWTAAEMRRARAMRQAGKSMKEIGTKLHVSAATASYWSRGLTGCRSVMDDLREERLSARKVRIARVFGGSCSRKTDVELVEMLELMKAHVPELTPSQRRRLARFSREILLGECREAKKDRDFAELILREES